MKTTKSSINQLSFLNRLKTKWKLENLWQVVAILCVFSLSGSSVLFLRPLFFDLLGVEPATPTVLKVIFYILFIFPAYQVLLLGYGWLFGQYSFFLQKMKKIGALFISKQSTHLKKNE